MKGFQKLALASAIAALPMSGIAMEPLNDSALSDVTGQDGINITLDGNISTDLWFEDTHGHDAFSNGGFLTVEGIGVSLDGVTLDIDVASDSTGANSGALVVTINSANPITMTNLSIGVQGSSATGGEAADITRVGDIVDSEEIMSIDSISLTPNEMVMMLGPESKGTTGTGNLLEITGNTGAIVLSDVEIRGGAGAADGAISISELTVSDVNLGVGGDETTVNLAAGGLVVVTSGAMADIDVSLSRLAVGDNTQEVMGNAYLTGLDLGGMEVTITGKQ